MKHVSKHDFKVVHSEYQALQDIFPESLETSFKSESLDDYMSDLFMLRNQAQGIVVGLNNLIKALGGNPDDDHERMY
jgi:hypothetical protein